MAIRKTAAKKPTGAAKKKVAPKKTAVAKKVTATAKKTAKKVVKKTTPKKKSELEVGAGYECSVCGLEVIVETACDCGDTCDLMCCGEPMEMI